LRSVPAVGKRNNARTSGLPGRWAQAPRSRADVSAETSAAPPPPLAARPPRLFAETPQAQRQADALALVAEAALAEGLAGNRYAEAFAGADQVIIASHE
jgi:hypothetical protein